MCTRAWMDCREMLSRFVDWWEGLPHDVGLAYFSVIGKAIHCFCINSDARVIVNEGPGQ